MRQFLCAIGILGATGATAEPLSVAVDIAPVGSLAALVLGEHGVVTQLVPPNGDVHGFSLTVRGAQAAQDADVIIHIGDVLMPELGDKLAEISSKASIIALDTVAGTSLLPVRDLSEVEGFASLEKDDHEDEHGHEDEHDHCLLYTSPSPRDS